MAGRILMVDDNPKNLQVLGNVLKANGYTFEFSTSGKGALKWIESDSFDLILLDIMMPEMDGFEVASHIRKNAELDDLPIIFLTAKVDSESVVKGFEIGGQDYVSKPFESSELLARIKTQIDLKQSKNNLKNLNIELEQKVEERTNELNLLYNELKESEKKYQYAFEASNDGLWDWNLENDTFDFSDGLYKMLGYEINEFPKLRSEINKRIHPDDLQSRNDKDYIAQFRKENLATSNEELRIKTKLGNYIWVHVKRKVVERDSNNQILRVVGTHTNITEEKRKNLDILNAILKTEDTERTRMSQEIHDGLHQTLTISAMNFMAAKKSFDNNLTDYKEKFDAGFEYLQKGIVESREIAHTLMPKAIVDFGLISACESLVDEMNLSSKNTKFVLQHNFENKRLENHQVELILYRVLQEALSNVKKYANASVVTIQIKDYDDLLMMTIEDNGIGFNLEATEQTNKGTGLKSMKDRLNAIFGSFEIESQPNKGTSIIVQIEKNKLLNL